MKVPNRYLQASMAIYAILLLLCLATTAAHYDTIEISPPRLVAELWKLFGLFTLALWTYLLVHENLRAKHKSDEAQRALEELCFLLASMKNSLPALELSLDQTSVTLVDHHVASLAKLHRRVIVLLSTLAAQSIPNALSISSAIDVATARLDAVCVCWSASHSLPQLKTQCTGAIHEAEQHIDVALALLTRRETRR